MLVIHSDLIFRRSVVLAILLVFGFFVDVSSGVADTSSVAGVSDSASDRASGSREREASGQNSYSPSDVDDVVYDRIPWSEYIFGDDTFDNVENEVSRNWTVSDEERRSVVSRGEYLVKSVATCGYCHGAVLRPNDPSAPLSGGRTIEISGKEFVAPNITPSKEVGIGNFSLPDIVGLIRGSLGRDGAAVSSEVHGNFKWVSDHDAKAIAAYLLTLPAVESQSVGSNDTAKSELEVTGEQVVGYMPQPPQTQSAEYGMYLAKYVAGCSRCHKKDGGFFSEDVLFSGSDSSGGDDADKQSGLSSAPDIRGGGNETRLKSWKVKDYEKYLTEGVKPEGGKRDGNFCPVNYYSGMSQSDRASVAMFLKKLK